MSAGIVHLVSTNPFHGNTMKKSAPSFFCTNILPKNKHAFNFRPSKKSSISISCKAKNRNNNGKTPNLSSNNETDSPNEILPILTSKNGRSNPKSASKDEIRKVFSKYFPPMQEASENRTINNNNSRNYGNYLPKLVPEKQDKGQREAFESLLKLLKESRDVKKNTNPVPNVNDGTNAFNKLFEEDGTGTGTESELEEEEGEGEEEDLFSDEISDFEEDEDDVPVPVPVQKSRPASSFSKRSPIPEVKYEPVVQLKEKKKDESVFYEPVSIDSSDDESDSFENLDLDSGILEEEEEDSESGILEEEDLESGILEEEDLKEEESVDLESLKIVELKEIAKSRGMKGYSKMKKADLVEFLRSG